MPAQDLASMVKVYRDRPTVARRSQIEHFAVVHTKDQKGALARLALGITAIEQKDYPRAITNLKAAQSRLPNLEDYAVYYLASAQLQVKDAANISTELERFHSLPLASPLSARALVLGAKALTDLKNPAEAVRVLTERYAELPQPDGDFTLASAYEAASDLHNAAVYYQRVYFQYPDTEAAARASAALVLLKESMGPAYPAATGTQMLERGDKWMAAHEYIHARQEFTSMASQLSGLERDQARVRMGAADFLRGENALAYRYLESLDLPRSEADAERPYYLAECQRRMNASDERLDTVKRLGKQYAQSPWRLKALVSAGNAYVVLNRPDVFEPLFKTAYEEFPSASVAPYCHWKVAWSSYIHRRRDAADRFREHLERYSLDPRTGAAMYFLGRLSESDKDASAARAYYAKINELYPNYYYSILARERLADPKIVAAEPSSKVVQYLENIGFLSAAWPPTGSSRPYASFASIGRGSSRPRDCPTWPKASCASVRG